MREAAAYCWMVADLQLLLPDPQTTALARPPPQFIPAARAVAHLRPLPSRGSPLSFLLGIFPSLSWLSFLLLLLEGDGLCPWPSVLHTLHWGKGEILTPGFCWALGATGPSALCTDWCVFSYYEYTVDIFLGRRSPKD